MSNLPDLWRNAWPRELENFFEGFGLPSLRRFDSDLTRHGFNPKCEVTEDKEAYHLKFDLPGIPKDQIKIDLHDSQLTVSGERKLEKKEDSKRQHFSEVHYGAFSRSMTFPTSVNNEKVLASYENGILSITVPKAEASRSRQITIK
jgi:HSP20 family protein